MKDDKDIIIDALTARIRELENELCSLKRTCNSTKRKNIKPLINESYVEESGLDEIFYKPIDILKLKTKLVDALKAENVTTIGHLVSCEEFRVIKKSRLGKNAINEIDKILEQLGLDWGMTHDNKRDYKNS